MPVAEFGKWNYYQVDLFQIPNTVYRTLAQPANACCLWSPTFAVYYIEGNDMWCPNEFNGGPKTNSLNVLSWHCKLPYGVQQWHRLANGCLKVPA